MIGIESVVNPASGLGDIVDVILHHASERPHAMAIKDDERVLSYDDAVQQIAAAASNLS